jgi:hypothetical protein
MTLPRPLLLLVSLLLAATLAACDSNGDDDPTPADIAGTYDVAEFRFVPDAGAITAANVLDTLVADGTSVRVLSGGDFTFEYEFEGGVTRSLSGEVEVRTDEVRFTFDAADAARREQLLLPESLVFDREDDGELSASEEISVDLEAFDEDFYDGIDDEQGELTLRLTPRVQA